MENSKHNSTLEEDIRFVAKHYRDGSFDADRAWSRFASDNGVVHISFMRRHLMGIAASLLAIVALSTWMLIERQRPDWVAVETAVGQIKDVYLPDSTLVSLAGNSCIQYDAKSFNRNERAVRMSGRAFFDVTRDENRPFSISVGEGEIRVLGTSFQVDGRSDHTRVEVATGRVSFTAGGEEALLTAGRAATYFNEERSMDISTIDGDGQWSWRSGELRFNNTPLDRVVDELIGFYGVDIVDHHGGGNKRLTATFSDMSLEDVVEVVNQTLDVDLRVTPIK